MKRRPTIPTIPNDRRGPSSEDFIVRRTNIPPDESPQSERDSEGPHTLDSQDPGVPMFDPTLTVIAHPTGEPLLFMAIALAKAGWIAEIQMVFTRLPLAHDPATTYTLVTNAPMKTILKVMERVEVMLAEFVPE